VNFAEFPVSAIQTPPLPATWLTGTGSRGAENIVVVEAGAVARLGTALHNAKDVAPASISNFLRTLRSLSVGRSRSGRPLSEAPMPRSVRGSASGSGPTAIWMGRHTKKCRSSVPDGTARSFQRQQADSSRLDGRPPSEVGVPALTSADALQAFAGQPVAVLGTADEAGTPHLVPVTFALVANCVVFAVDFKPKASARLRRLDNIQVRPAVSFLVDEYHEDWERLWWVRVDAHAKILREAPGNKRYEEAVDGLAAKYPQYRDVRPSGAVVIAEVVRVTGWAFTRGLKKQAKPWSG